MSQTWINNIPEVDWHGANGSIQISGEPAASRYCVTGETLIKTNKGTLPIKELINWSDEQNNLKDIYIYDYLNNLVPATKIFNCGKHPVMKITLKNGQNITVTDNHPIVVLNPDDCDLLWKEAKELTLEDKVAIPVFNYTIDQNDIDYTSGELEFKMLGCMISEGYITTQNRIGINNTDIDLIQPVYDYFYSQIPELKAKITYNEKRKYYEFCIANINYYNKFITKYKYTNNAKDKELPEIIFRTTLENKACFLRYLFEGDGGLTNANTSSPSIVYSSYSKKLIEQLQILLLQDFNIFSRIGSSQRKTGIEYKLYISGRGLVLWKQKIGFISKRKNELLLKAIKSFESNKTIANGSYYSTTEFSYYVRKKAQNSYCQKHAFSNYKNFYKCEKYLDPFNYERLETLLTNYLFVPIKSIELQAEEQEVFSVRVDNLQSDHSYIANGFINHNTEARLSKATEEGLLANIKKHNVPMKLNFSEDEEWPEVFPALMPRLMVNGCQGIGSTIANVWLPHSLNDLAEVILKYVNTGELDYENLAPSFPTGGTIINKKDLSVIYKTGKGKVVLRGKAEIKGNNILITEIPYQVYVEPLIEKIKKLALNEEIPNINNVLNKSDKKRLLIEVECEQNPSRVLELLYKNTDLQKSFSANQYALVDKVPKLLTLKEYLDIYLNHNYDCIKREYDYDLTKAKDRLEIVEGLIKALEDIDNIIALIKKSESTAAAAQNLILTYQFTERQAKAIIDMKLGKLAHLEKVALNQEKEELTSTIEKCEDVINHIDKRKEIYINRFSNYIKKYGKDRKTELTQIEVSPVDKEIQNVEPEKCVVIMTEGGSIKRIPTASFRTQKRNGKGIKSTDDITSAIIRTNTVDSLMIFTNKGKMYRILVDDIPEGTNSSAGRPIRSLVAMEDDEEATLIYSIYRDTEAKYVLFATKNGLVKKTALSEYTNTRKKTGLAAINIRENDSLVHVSLVKDEDLIIVTKMGMGIRISSKEIPIAGRTTSGIKGISLKTDDSVIAVLPVRNSSDYLAIISEKGFGKKISSSELPLQKRAGKGLIVYKPKEESGNVACCVLVDDNDSILIAGHPKNICIAAKEVPLLNRGAVGNQLIKSSSVTSVSKV